MGSLLIINYRLNFRMKIILSITKPVIIVITIVSSLLTIPTATFAWKISHTKHVTHVQHKKEEKEVVHPRKFHRNKPFFLHLFPPVISFFNTNNNVNNNSNTNTSNNSNTNTNNPNITINQSFSQTTGSVNVTQNNNKEN